MARTLFDPIGSGSSRPVTLTAANAITAGDLIVALNGGDAVSATSNQLASRLNRDTSSIPANFTGAFNGYSGNTGTAGQIVRAQRSAVLSNGNVVELSYGDGTTNTTGLYYLIRSPGGGIAVPRTQISASTLVGSAFPAGVCALTGGGFAYFFSSSATDTAGKYGVISNAGSTVLAPTALVTGGNTIASGNQRLWSISALSSGGFGVAGYTSGTATLFAWVFNAAGTLQGSQTSLLVATLTGIVATLGASNGDFVIFADDATNAIGGRLWRYTAAGVIVGSVQTPFAGTSVSSSSHSGLGRIAELTGGSIVVLGGAAGASSAIRAYTTTNTAVAAAVVFGASVAIVPAQASFGWETVVATSSGGCVIFYQATSAIIYYVALTSSLAVAQSGPTGLTGGNATITAAGFIWAYTVGAAGYSVSLYSINSGSNALLEHGALAQDFTLINSKLTTIAQGGAGNLGELGLALSNDKLNLYVGAWTQATLLYTINVVGVAGCSIIGVAQSSAASGGQFVANTVGKFDFNQTFSGGSLSFDRRASTPFGNRGALVGQSALLYGTQT